VSESQPDLEQVAEDFRRLKVPDLLAGTCSMLGSLAYGKLSGEGRDLEQARLAIEALKAIGPLLPDDARRDVQQLTANLQLAYADAASAAG
jgi:hypothetical protein